MPALKGRTSRVSGSGSEKWSVPYVSMWRLLARFAGRVVDQAHLGFGLRGRLGAAGRDAARRHGVELAALAGGLLGRRGRQRAQVVRGLEAALPRELVRVVELLAR